MRVSYGLLHAVICTEENLRNYAQTYITTQQQLPIFLSKLIKRNMNFNYRVSEKTSITTVIMLNLTTFPLQNKKNIHFTSVNPNYKYRKSSILCNLLQNANLIDARFDDATFYLVYKCTMWDRLYKNENGLQQKKARGNRTWPLMATYLLLCHYYNGLRYIRSN